MDESVDELLEQYQRHAEVHASIDYGDRSSVREGNRAADQMIALAKHFATLEPSATRVFATLLDCEATATWAAHHLVEHLSPDDETKQRALAAIELVASGDGPEAMGNRMWLDEWREQERHTT